MEAFDLEEFYADEEHQMKMKILLQIVVEYKEFKIQKNRDKKNW